MARGWESKSVEAQIEEKESAEQVKPRSVGEVQQSIELRNLELARVKVVHELASTQNERYTQMLQQSLMDLEKKIEALK